MHPAYEARGQSTATSGANGPSDACGEGTKNTPFWNFLRARAIGRWPPERIGTEHHRTRSAPQWAQNRPSYFRGRPRLNISQREKHTYRPLHPKDRSKCKRNARITTLGERQVQNRNHETRNSPFTTISLLDQTCTRRPAIANVASTHPRHLRSSLKKGLGSLSRE